MSELKLPLCTGDGIEDLTTIYDADGEHVASSVVHDEADEIIRICNAFPDLVAACEFMQDFYLMDTNEFVAKYGHGHSTRSVGERAIAALKKARDEHD